MKVLTGEDNIGKPARQAAQKKSGFVKDRDFRGKKVLAYCEYLPELDWGVVSKIDNSEILKPFYEASMYAFISSILLVLIGTYFFKRFSDPIYKSILESEEKYRIILEANPDPVVAYDMEGKVTYFNMVFKNVLVWTLEECFGKTMDVFVPEDAWPETKMMIDKVLSGENFSGIETRRYTKEGKIIPVSISGAIYRDEDGNPMGSVINLRDIGEQKELEQQLQQAVKMEAVGTLAGGIAHDFNNLLMGIQGCTSLMSLDTDNNHPNFEYLNRIEDYIKKAADLTRQLLGFARSGKYEVKPTDMNEIIDKSSDMFGRTKKEITIHKKNQEHIWTVDVDQSQIEQVILNLYVNAWQAMSGIG